LFNKKVVNLEKIVKFKKISFEE